MNDDEMDPVLAVANLVERSGGRQFEIGWLNDEGTVHYQLHGPLWWAKAQYRGVRRFCEGQPDPARAADGLAHMILDGGKCQHCGMTTTTAQTPIGTYIHARPPDPHAACVWFRDGNEWRRGCD